MLSVFSVLFNLNLRLRENPVFHSEIGAEKIDAFHDAFDRFRGGGLFLRAKSIRSRSLIPLRFSCFVARLRHYAPPFRVVDVAWEKDRDHLIRAPVKETRMPIDPKQVPQMIARALELFSRFTALPP